MKKIVMMLIGLISVASASAQISIALGSAYNVVAGTKVNIPVTVTGLDASNGGSSITSAEIHILYQINNLSYDTTMNITSITNPTDWIYNATETDYGTTWQDPAFNAFSFPDGTVLFEVVFDYRGGITVLDLDSVRCVLSDVDYNILPVNHFIDGLITPAEGSDLSLWNGTGDWNTSGNWSNGVPGINTIATIESGMAEIQSNANCKSLSVNSVSSLHVLPGYTLTVSEGIVNSGTFTIESDETGTGSVIANGTVEGTGSFTTELFADFTKAASHLVSSPSIAPVASVYAGLSPEKYDESTSSWQAVNVAETIPKGKGLKISSETNNTIVVSGPFNSGDVSITDLLYTSGNNSEFRGLNLVGNPFPSAIRADLPNWNKTGVGNGVYLWNGYNYLCWNGFVGSLTDGIIPGMQGFFIRSSEPASSLTIPAISRLHSTLPFYKETRELQNTLVFKFSKETDPEHFDEAFISLSPDASSAYEPVNDVMKLSGDPAFPQIYTLSSDDNKLAINTQSDFASIPVIFNANGAAAYRISVSGISSFATDTPLFLEDKLVPDNTINLRSTQSFLFSFEDGYTPDNRFYLHFSTIGINELSSDFFNAWINGGTLHIESSQLQKIEQLQLISLTGSVLYSFENLTTPSTIRLDKCSGGIGILRIRTAEGIFTKKILLIN